MLKLISKLSFRLAGWKVAGGVPPGIKKFVMVAAPHTSNYDFILARAGCFILDIKLKFLIKKDWMFFPMGIFLKSIGAVPVERSKTTNMVDSMVEMFNQSEELAIMVSPEGTRKNNKKWKTGFYYAALGANVPLILASLDYKKKIACVGKVVHLTGDITRDMEQVREYYRHITPKYPEKYSLDLG